LHTTPDKWHEKVDAAYKAGCRRFDGAIQGFGGCPMATDTLTGNMPTEKLLSYFTVQQAETHTRPMSFESAYNEAYQNLQDLSLKLQYHRIHCAVFPNNWLYLPAI